MGDLLLECFDSRVQDVEVDDEFRAYLDQLQSRRVDMAVLHGNVLSRQGVRERQARPDISQATNQYLHTLIAGDGMGAIDKVLEEEMRSRMKEVREKFQVSECVHGNALRILGGRLKWASERVSNGMEE